MSNPPPLPFSPVPPVPAPIDPRSLRVIGGAFGLTALCDFLVWSPTLGGAGVAAAIVALAAAFAISAKERPWRLYVYFALAVASAGQALLELKFSTIAVSLVALLGIVAEGHFGRLLTLAARWFEALPAVFLPVPALGRLRALCPDPAQMRAGAGRQIGRVWRVGQIALPALLLGGVFSIFFAQGNAVFRELVSAAFGRVLDWLMSIDLSPTRFLFWLILFVLLLSLLRPVRTGLGEWLAKCRVPRWERADVSLGWWQSVMVLGALNVLFCYVNTIDVIYLWRQAALPSGVNLSEFLHEGVQSLILAVLLSAAILVVLFQQRLADGSRLLKVLASAWVLQNIIVIAGVFLRLKLYVDAYQLSTLRVGVALFLTLVIAGYALLTVYFWRGQGFEWLVRANIISTFALFFIVQFADLDAAVARYNTDRWVRDHTRPLDVNYLASLGEGSWPSLIQLARERAPRADSDLATQLRRAEVQAQGHLAIKDWRHWEYGQSQRAREMADFHPVIVPAE